MLAIGLLLNPTTTPVFSQEGSVSIAPRAADPNSDLSFDPPQISVQQEARFRGQMMIQYNIL
ncbi:MAG: hypothetical protein ACXWFZ_07565 [Nitrososphaeraceae archaeon]